MCSWPLPVSSGARSVLCSLASHPTDLLSGSYYNMPTKVLVARDDCLWVTHEAVTPLFSPSSSPSTTLTSFPLLSVDVPTRDRVGGPSLSCITSSFLFWRGIGLVSLSYMGSVPTCTHEDAPLLICSPLFHFFRRAAGRFFICATADRTLLNFGLSLATSLHLPSLSSSQLQTCTVYVNQLRSTPSHPTPILPIDRQLLHLVTLAIS